MQTLVIRRQYQHYMVVLLIQQKLEKLYLQLMLVVTEVLHTIIQQVYSLIQDLVPLKLELISLLVQVLRYQVVRYQLVKQLEHQTMLHLEMSLQVI